MTAEQATDFAPTLTDAERVAEVLAAHVLGARGIQRQCACGYLLPVGPDAYLHREHVAGLLARAVDAARADERERCAQDVDGPGYGTAAIRLRFLARKRDNTPGSSDATEATR